MLIPAAAGLVALTAFLAGGRLIRLTTVRIRWGWVLLAALAIQVVIISVVPHWPGALLAAIHLATYGLAGAFVWVNRRIPGLGLIALGGFANLLAIAANGGVMPASPAALRTAGITPSGAFENSTVVADAKLQFLGDIFAIPAGWPLANVFSIGDVLIVLGVGVALHRICGSKLVPARFAWTPDDVQAERARS